MSTPHSRGWTPRLPPLRSRRPPDLHPARTDDGQTTNDGGDDNDAEIGATELNFDDVAEEERGKRQQKRNLGNEQRKSEGDLRGDRFQRKMWKHEGGEKPDDNHDEYVHDSLLSVPGNF